MTTWSGLRKQVHERMAASVRHRVRLQVTHYRRAHDAEGRWALEIDGAEVGGIGCIRAHWAEYEIIERLRRERGGSVAELQRVALEEIRAEGRHPVNTLRDAVEEYFRLGITAARESKDVVVRSLALCDRRFGRRRLLALREEPPAHPMELAVFRLRIEAEGIDGQSKSCG